MVVVDLETTGLDPVEHGVVDFGAVDLNDPDRQFSMKCHIDHDDGISEEALEVNGQSIDEVMNQNRPDQETAFKEWRTWANKGKNRTLAGHNLAGFDVLFLKEIANNIDEDWTFGHRFVDLHSVAYSKAKQVNYKVELGYNDTSPFHAGEIYDLVNIPDEPEPHKAIRGALWESEAFARLIHGISLFERFSDHSIPDYLS